MTKPSPSELRKREVGIESFDRHWYVDVNTSEIRHNELDWKSKFIDFFWKKKYTVSDLYWWTSRNWSSSKMIVYPTSIKHDDISIKGFPRKYQMMNSWTIPENDLKYLYNGPLVDESGQNVLVKHQSRFQKFISILSQLKPISWIITTVLSYKILVELWNWVLSLIN